MWNSIKDSCFSFTGRISRKNYVVGLGIIFFVMLGFSWWSFLLLIKAVKPLSESRPSDPADWFNFNMHAKLYIIIAVIYLIIIVSLNARRLHDIDYSGWWQLAIYSVQAVLLAGLFWASPFEAAFTQLFALWATLIFYLVFFIFLSAKRGTIGPNKYGTDPLQVTNIETTI